MTTTTERISNAAARINELRALRLSPHKIQPQQDHCTCCGQPLDLLRMPYDAAEEWRTSGRGPCCAD